MSFRTNYNQAQISFLLLIITSFSSQLAAINGFEVNNTLTQLDSEETLAFTHLNWLRVNSNKISIKLLPIKNYSGIPMEQRIEKSNYFEHGKIPQTVYSLFSDLVNASHFLTTHNQNSVYEFQLSINQYQLPYRYAPDDVWWKDIQDDVDRWQVKPKDMQISLTLMTKTNRPVFNQWSRTIKMTLSNCDINTQSQPLLSLNSDSTMRAYVTTAPGQAFVAASNFLLLQAIYYINENNNIAHVANKSENELLLVSDGQSFVIGEELPLYPNNTYSNLSTLPTGKVKIIKTHQNQAVAYPLNLRADQVKTGDWVQMSSSIPFPVPKPHYHKKNKCEKSALARL